MPSDPILAIADDLTGAAEIAAIGHRAGCHAQIDRRFRAPDATELTVIDTDTRLATPTAAAGALSALGAAVARRDWRFIYKKTDSVLRGPVLAELTALAAALGKKTVLLVPANPSLGRVIRGGNYFIDDVPLHETAFARDPHHPARTCDVAELLGQFGPVRVLAAGSRLPVGGVVVGEVASSTDVREWARRVDADVLPAGGGAFFAAVLSTHAGRSTAASVVIDPVRPTLHLCGSMARPQHAPAVFSIPSGLFQDDANACSRWSDRVVAALSTCSCVTVAPPADRSSAPEFSARLGDVLAQLARRAVAARACRHLMLEGGSTAATIIAHLGWDRLTVVREWAQGVVTLRPLAAVECLVTMKPGSYAWPDSLWSHVNPAH